MCVLFFILYTSRCLIPEKAILQRENKTPITFSHLKATFFWMLWSWANWVLMCPWTPASPFVEYISAAMLLPRETAPALLVPSSCLPGGQALFQHLPTSYLFTFSSSFPASPASRRWGAHTFWHGHKAIIVPIRSMGPYVETPKASCFTFQIVLLFLSSCCWGCISSSHQVSVPFSP